MHMMGFLVVLSVAIAYRNPNCRDTSLKLVKTLLRPSLVDWVQLFVATFPLQCQKSEIDDDFNVYDLKYEAILTLDALVRDLPSV